jgi:Xaa-Pro dipeptidase
VKARVRSIFEKLTPTPDALLLANSVDPLLDQSFFYLFDVPSGLFEGSVAIARPDGQLEVFSSPLEEESALQGAKQDPDVRVLVYASREDRDRILKELLPAPATCALNYRELTHEWYLQLQKIYPETNWIDATNAIRSVRQVKDPEEIARLDRAAKIASSVANEIPSMLRRGMTELQLAAEIEYRMMQLGASGRAFNTIVGFGRNSAEPHYSPRDVQLEPNANIVCDFGALYRRYCSDITRSFRFGSTDEELRRVHQTVQEAQQAALSVIRSGIPAKEVHLAAQKVIDDSPWKGRFTHGLGHSIGLAVHDGFGMAGTIEEPLQAGMAITVEPGIYLPGRGGVRIEDDVVVTENGYELLTTARREYIEVGA